MYYIVTIDSHDFFFANAIDANALATKAGVTIKIIHG